MDEAKFVVLECHLRRLFAIIQLSDVLDSYGRSGMINNYKVGLHLL